MLKESANKHPLLTSLLVIVMSLGLIFAGLTMVERNGGPVLLSNILIILGVTFFVAASLWLTLFGLGYLPDKSCRENRIGYLGMMLGTVIFASLWVFYLMPLG